MAKWVTLFSQTGSEIVSISKALGIKPDVIMTNNFDESKYHPDLLHETITVATHKDLMSLLNFDPSDTLITLHGYLRIIPPEVCERYEMYNGHPGAIALYPELKGKDPQEKVWQEISKYHNIGSVVHKVTPGVDEGEIVSAVNIVNCVQSIDELFDRLRETSLQAWLFFLQSKLK